VTREYRNPERNVRIIVSAQAENRILREKTPRFVAALTDLLASCGFEGAYVSKSYGGLEIFVY
jgi:hypothetical protein